MNNEKAKQIIEIADSITDLQSYREAVMYAKILDHAYFKMNNPQVDDWTYDYLYGAIAEYEEKYPNETLPSSPTQHVGSDIHTSDHTIAHDTPMMSTEKAQNIDKVIKWVQNTRKRVLKLSGVKDMICPFTVEWKFDGISCSLVYMNGLLVEASTRGDYRFGKDILAHVKNIPNIPQTLYKGARGDDGVFYKSGTIALGRIEVRGEILLPFAELDKFPSYSDTRTAAGALLNTDVPTQSKDSLLQFKAWQLITDSTTDLTIRNETNMTSLGVLYDELGFDVEECDMFFEDSQIEEIINDYASCRKDNPYPTDGLVIKVEPKTYWDALGRTEHHPKFCIAYKFPPQTAITYCTSVFNTIGETGKVTPIAYFTPVEIGGKTISKASLGSERIAEQLGIKPGSKIEVSLRNDVIPHVERVIK